MTLVANALGDAGSGAEDSFDKTKTNSIQLHMIVYLHRFDRLEKSTRLF